MDKKDIYEHLAKIYLDASSKKKKKSKLNTSFYRNVSLVSIALLLVISVFFFKSQHKNNPYSVETALVILAEPARINFNFDPAKKESFTIDLNKLDLLRYNTLIFSLKKLNLNDKINLRVDFTSAFHEGSEVYIKDLPNKWQEFKINLSDFKGISDWSEMKNLSFTVEAWNASGRQGIVFIDNVRVAK